jgi:hypothetical protein
MAASLDRARPRRKRGRPFLYPQDPMAQVTVRLPQSIFDRYCRLAHKHDVPLLRLLRTTLMRHLPSQ